ncbi:MAG: CaiB/BaiF CoA-transferase family protein [Actinomycetota bacterium]
MTAPLEGVIVVALEQAVAAPFATRQLADLGATVLKVERPGDGDFARNYDSKVNGQSAFFVWCNRGKQSITLDLKDDADQATFRALIAGADVFVQNLSHAAAHRAVIAADQLLQRHPALIACDISGYGGGGPRTDDKAYDLAIQAEAGAMAVTGSADDMSKVGFSVADIAAGMYCLTSVLAALHRRERTGVGAAIEVSMLESLAEWTTAPVLAAAYTDHVPARAGHRHALIAPYGLFDLSDGRRVLIAVQSDPEWRSMAEHLLGDASLGTEHRFATNADRIANVDDLEAVIAARLCAISGDDAVAGLRAGRIAHAWARDQLEVWNHEQLRARGRFMTVSTATGDAEVYKPPFNISGLPEPAATIPSLGEHDPALIAALTRRGGS